MWFSSKHNNTEFEWQCAEYAKVADVGIRVLVFQKVHDFPRNLGGEYTEGLSFIQVFYHMLP